MGVFSQQACLGMKSGKILPLGAEKIIPIDDIVYAIAMLRNPIPSSASRIDPKVSATIKKLQGLQTVIHRTLIPLIKANNIKILTKFLKEHPEYIHQYFPRGEDVENVWLENILNYETLLHIAVALGKLECTQLFVLLGADVNAKIQPIIIGHRNKRSSQTPLDIAYMPKNQAIFDFLEEHGAQRHRTIQWYEKFLCCSSK